MNATKVILVVTCVGCTAVVWTSRRNIAATREELAPIAAHQVALKAELITAQSKRANLEQALVELRAQPKAKPSPAPARQHSNSKPTTTLNLIRDNPQLQNLQYTARRAQIAITFGPLYRALALTPSAIETFEDNLQRYEIQQADLDAAAAAEGKSTGDPGYKNLMGEARTDYLASQEKLLGKDGALKARDYDRFSIVREMVSGMAGAAAMAGTPIDLQQAEQLTQSLASASRNHSGDGPIFTDSIDWRTVHERAKTFLSPAQLTFIETTESRGPRGSGGRFLPQLNAAFEVAAKEETTPTP